MKILKKMLKEFPLEEFLEKNSQEDAEIDYYCRALTKTLQELNEKMVNKEFVLAYIDFIKSQSNV